MSFPSSAAVQIVVMSFIQTRCVSDVAWMTLDNYRDPRYYNCYYYCVIIMTIILLLLLLLL